MDTRQADGDARGSLFLVADGMGGHSAGNVASQMAVEQVMEHYYKLDIADPSECLRRSVEEANRLIFEAAQANMEYFRMGTTLVGAAIVGNVAHIANVGDSRAYLVRSDKITQITRDHSWVALQVEMGELTPEEAQVSQNRSVLLRCLGEKSDVLVDILQLQLKQSDILVLCTDGLHGLVTPDEIKDQVMASPPQEACDFLVQLANERGGHDNVTVEVVRVESCAPQSDESDDIQLRAVPPPPSSAPPPQPPNGQPAAVITVPTPPVPAKAPPAEGTSSAATQTAALGRQVQWLGFLLAFLAGVILTLLLGELLGGDNTPAPLDVSPSPNALASPLPSGEPSPDPGQSAAAMPASEEGVRIVTLRAPVHALAADGTWLYWAQPDPSPVLMRLDVKAAGGPQNLPLQRRRPSAIALQANDFYLAQDNGILRYAIAPGRAFKMRGGPSARFGTRNAARLLAPTASTLYWVEEGGRDIFAASLVKNKSFLAFRGDAPIVGLVTAAKALYWAEEGRGLRGGAPLTASAAAAASADTETSSGAASVPLLVASSPTHLATDGKLLFWTEEPRDDSQETRVRSCSLNGREVTTLTTLPGPVLALAVDGKNIYWVAAHGSNFVIQRLPRQR